MGKGISPRRLFEQQDCFENEMARSEVSRISSAHTATLTAYNNLNRRPLDITSITDAQDLTTHLWDNSKDIIDLIPEAGYILGIKKGTLDPNNYGKYTIQDAIYCHSATNNLDTLRSRAATMGDKALEDFAANRKKSFQNYTESMFKEWHIKDPSGIQLSESAQNYVELEQQIARLRSPLYTIIAMLPCEMLWVWLANKIDNEMPANEKLTNLYYFWVRDNKESSRKFQNYINNRTSEIDVELAVKIYRQAMISEYNFFRSACQEASIPLEMSAAALETFRPRAFF